MMTRQPLKFVSERIVSELFENIEENLDLYVSGDFSKLAAELGWALETKYARIDPSFADKLVLGSGKEAEIANSLVVFGAFEGMTPALARDERIWARLCHVEGLVYARSRWIGKDAERDIKNHFFASNLSQCRDDNAIGRLWWNGYLANQINPANPQAVLEEILARANIRLQFVDRANASFRLPLAQGLVRLLGSEPWLNSHDRAFEHFMLVLDKNAGGRLFEVVTDKEMDQFLRANLPLAKKVHAERVGS
jgi:hypothetical protein